MRKCDHDFQCHVGIHQFEDKPEQGAVEVTGACRLCGVPLVFYGPRGAGSTQPMASVDRLELRAPVTFGYSSRFKAAPEFRIDGPEIVPLGEKGN